MSSPTLLIIKGAISELPPEEKKRVEQAADLIRQVLEQYGPCGIVALALVGAEEQEKN